MTYIVNDNCIKCKLMDCVEVCPVDCFYEGENMLAIKPDECIDCGVCEPECPIDESSPIPKRKQVNGWTIIQNTANYGQILLKREQRMCLKIKKNGAVLKISLNISVKNQEKEIKN